MSLYDNMFKVVKTQWLTKFERIKDIAIEDLKTEIDATVYNEWPEVYEWTYSLKKSITGEVKFEGNKVIIQIYFDPSKLEHTSVVSDSSTYNGKEIFVPSLIDEGHYEEGYNQVDYFHIYPGAHFIQKAIDRIKQDLGTAVLFTIKKTGGKSFY